MPSVAAVLHLLFALFGVFSVARSLAEAHGPDRTASLAAVPIDE